MTQFSEDIRIRKTHRILFLAMRKLLSQHSFKKISVLGLCEEASVGRATFYAHFDDKYQFLRAWLKNLDADCARREVIECTTTGFRQSVCRKVIANIITDADFETMEIANEYIQSLFDVHSVQKPSNARETQMQVFADFFGSGMLGLLVRQCNQYATADTLMSARSLLTIIDQFHKWSNSGEPHR